MQQQRDLTISQTLYIVMCVDEVTTGKEWVWWEKFEFSPQVPSLRPTPSCSSACTSQVLCESPAWLQWLR